MFIKPFSIKIALLKINNNWTTSHNINKVSTIPPCTVQACTAGIK